MWRISQLGERWAAVEATRQHGADFGCLAAGAAVETRSSPAPAKPLDVALARRMELERAERERREEFDALIRASERRVAALTQRIDAHLSPYGQLLAAGRRNGW